MKKSQRIKELERDIRHQQEDYQHTHDALWKVLSVICDEFGLSLTVVAKDNPAPDFTERLVRALEAADWVVPHNSQKFDDAMDDVWEMVKEYRLVQ